MFKSSSSPPFARLRDDEDSTPTAPFSRGEEEEDLDLLENDEAASAVFNYSPRPKTDRTFASVFLLITSACFLLGIVVVSNTNAKAFAQRTSEDVLFSTNCEAYRASSSSPTSRLLLSNTDEFKDTNDDLDDVFDGDDFWQSSHAWLLLAIVSAVALGVTFLYAFQYHASKATWGIIGFKLLSSFSFSLYMFAEGFVFANIDHVLDDIPETSNS
ncbi:unnamed protein product [Bathycoccus prasinos]